MKHFFLLFLFLQVYIFTHAHADSEPEISTKLLNTTRRMTKLVKYGDMENEYGTTMTTRRSLRERAYRRTLTQRELEVVDYWTPEARQNATPMELRVVTDPEHRNTRFLRHQLRVLASPNEDEDEDDIILDRWTGGGPMEQVSGRIFMVFDENKFSCSGTVVSLPGYPDRTLIATAAHCIYNEMRWYWATKFFFVPNQDDGGSDPSNRKCHDDPYGCWFPLFGVVDTDWARKLNNIPHDFGFLVVPNAGAHKGRVRRGPLQGQKGADVAMEDAVQAIPMDLTNKLDLQWGDAVTAMGLPGYESAKLLYATGEVKFEKQLLFVPGGGLTEGASGGSIVRDLDTNPTLVGFNVFKSGWWNETEEGEFKFVQTGCGGPSLWGSSFCSLAHIAVETALDDPLVTNEEAPGIIHNGTEHHASCLVFVAWIVIVTTVSSVTE